MSAIFGFWVQAFIGQCLYSDQGEEWIYSKHFETERWLKIVLGGELVLIVNYNTQ